MESTGSIKQTIEDLFDTTVLSNTEEEVTLDIQTGKCISQLYNEDCLHTMARMKENSIDFILTSPPYGTLRQYHGYKFDFLSTAKGMLRVLKENCPLVWIVGDQTINGSESLIPYYHVWRFKELGFNLYDTMIYRKLNHPPFNHRRYEQAFEFMFVLIKGKTLKTFNPIMEECLPNNLKKKPTSKFYRGNEDTPSKNMTADRKQHKIRDNVWAYLVGNHGDEGNVGHPAPFPYQLAVDHINSWTNPGDIVYDPMFGSGTTGLACKALNRHFIGSEISPVYCKKALIRLNTK